ncbi:hypothetical protein GNP94_22005 [Paenibacillus campinasensis]|uniref:Head fiber protein n=1 Tax=Paenibacillus campinasensis TaxID=66347 RepID=A0ABW9T5P5_9BACL|nr:hypothetical protein [Paenibacillus campinasensis]MUG68648.1 hypothetical protein [Paenibacillus campinasensis]
MSYETKNYATQDKWTVGGELAIVGDGKITKDGQPLSLDGGGSGLADGSVTLSKLADDTLTELENKLTARPAAAAPDTDADDVEGVRAELHDLKAKLRAAGILSA